MFSRPPRLTQCFSSLYTRQTSRTAVTLHRQHRLKASSHDESTLAGAQHKPRLSGPSMGHLISELSATTPQMVEDGLRVEGQTMIEEHRTFARRIAIVMVGLPCALAGGAGAWGLAAKIGMLA